MGEPINDLPLLKRILWADAILGGGTALIGLVLYKTLSSFLGLPANLIIVIAAITGLYAVVAFNLAWQRVPNIVLLKILIYANGAWTIISIALLFFYARGATVFGLVFLVLQVIAVGGLAYLEQRTWRKKSLPPNR